MDTTIQELEKSKESKRPLGPPSNVPVPQGYEIAPKIDFNYDEIPEGYYDLVAKQGRGIQRYWHQFKFDFVIEQINQEVSSKQKVKVIDLGSGPGTFLGKLSATRSIQGVGVDIARPQVDYANRTYGTPNLQFIASFIEENPIRDLIRTADVVTMIEVVEHMHLTDVKKILDYLYNNMKPGSRLFLTTPNYLSVWPLLEILVNYLSKVNYEEQHITKLNRRKVKFLLETTGFKEVRSRSFLHFSPFIAGLFGLRAAAPFSWCERKLLTHGGPLLCAQATR